MHEEAPHRLVEWTDLDPVTGEPIPPGGAWPVGLWRPPRVDLGIRWGPLPMLGRAAVILALIAVAFRAAMWLDHAQALDPADLVTTVALIAQTLFYGLAPAALLMARPDAAARHPVLVLGLLTACVGVTLANVWGGLWALQILVPPAAPLAVDPSMVVAVVTNVAAAIAAVLIASGLWSAPGPGARRRPGVVAAVGLCAVLLLYVGPDVRAFVTIGTGVDQGVFAAFLAAGLVQSVGVAWQAWAVVSRLRAGARRIAAWRSAGAWIALSIAGAILSGVFLILWVEGVALPDSVAPIVTDGWLVLGAVGAGFMTLAFGQGLPGFEPEAGTGEAPAGLS